MKGVVKNLHHIRLLRHQGDSSPARHVQRLENDQDSTGLFESGKTYNGKTKSHLVARPPLTIALPSTAD